MKRIIVLILVFSIILMSGCTAIKGKDQDLVKETIGVLGKLNPDFAYRNLLHSSANPMLGDSDYQKGSWRSASNGTGIREIVILSSVPVKGIEKGFHLTSSPDGKGGTEIGMDDVPVEFGVTYVFSCYAQGTGKLYLAQGKSPYQHDTFSISGTWKQYSFIFTVGNDDGSTSESPATNLYYGVSADSGSDVQICGMKLEKVIPSEWTPNAED